LDRDSSQVSEGDDAVTLFSEEDETIEDPGVVFDPVDVEDNFDVDSEVDDVTGSIDDPPALIPVNILLVAGMHLQGLAAMRNTQNNMALMHTWSTCSLKKRMIE